MMFIEVFAPKGALSADRQQHLAERLVTDLVSAPGAPEEMIARARSVTSVVFHEPAVWASGGRTLGPGPGAAPRYFVRLTLPEGHLSVQMRREIVTRTTRVLADSHSADQRLSGAPNAWIQIDEVPDGNLGAFGQVLSTADVMAFVTTGKAPTPPTDRAMPAATAIDPICAMTVELVPGALTLEREGKTVAFCSTVCRDTYAARTG